MKDAIQVDRRVAKTDVTVPITMQSGLHVKVPLSSENSLTHIQETRNMSRQLAEGEVFLAREQPGLQEVRGCLVEVSVTRFCVRHDFAGLCSGQEVAFRHDKGAGVAKVVWTSICGRIVESDLLILESTTR